MEPNEAQLQQWRWLIKQNLKAMTADQIRNAVRLFALLDGETQHSPSNVRWSIVGLLLPDSSLDLLRRDTELRAAWDAAREQATFGFFESPRWKSYEDWRANNGRAT